MKTRNLLLLFLLFTTSLYGQRLRQIAMIDLPGQPGFETLAFASGHLLVAHSAADSVDIFDLAKRRVIAQVKHVRGANGIAVDEKGERVFLSSPDRHSIVVISSSTWDVQGMIPVQSEVEHIVYAPGSNRVYMANSREQSIGYVDLAKNNEVHTMDAGGMPERLVFDPVKNVIYATLQDKHSVATYDLDLKRIQHWVLKASQPTGMALDDSARRLYVAVRYAVVTLDADSGTELSRVGAPGGVDSLWYDRQSGRLFAASGGAVSIMKVRDGGLTREAELNVDVRGHSIAYDPSTRLIYVPGGREGRSKLLVLKQFDGQISAFTGKRNKGNEEGQ
jgi:6-phosphogluconolactonase (cycloisomerase 2 family)